MKMPILCASLSACVLTLAAGHASAGTLPLQRVFSTNPAGICQSALPVFDGQIRKRPKAVQNEGTTAAFITCAFTSQGPDGVTTSAANPTAVRAYFIATDGASHQVACTGVPGWAGSATVTVSKTITVASPNSLASMSWVPGDFAAGATNFPTALFAISCALDPGVGIADSYVYFNEAQS